MKNTNLSLFFECDLGTYILNGFNSKLDSIITRIGVVSRPLVEFILSVFLFRAAEEKRGKEEKLS